MVICVRAYVVRKGFAGSYKSLSRLKWSTGAELEFDIFNPEAWRVFLRNDLRLPTKTADGILIGYNAYIFGGQYLNPVTGERLRGYLNLFPGYDGQGSPLPVGVYGLLVGADSKKAAERKIK